MKTVKYNHILLLIILSLLGNSCRTDNDTLEENLQENVQQNLANFDAYHFMYMHYPSGIMMGTSNGIVQIEYDNQNRPIKRKGGVLPLPSSIGFNYFFTPDYSEEITYENNEILLRVKLSAPYNTDALKTVLKTENGKIIRRVNVNSYTNDTINYVYNNDRIVKSVHKRILPVSESQYYYNSAGNVDSIVSKPLFLNQTTQVWQVDNTMKYRTVQTFKDYDNSPNPTKKLMLFEEIFNRSLSQNNYRAYESKSYNLDGSIGNSLISSWTFNYVNNEIKFAD